MKNTLEELKKEASKKPEWERELDTKFADEIAWVRADVYYKFRNFIAEQIDRATLAERENWKDICKECRGKGYRTEFSGTHGAADFTDGEVGPGRGDKSFDIPPHAHMVFCSCDRGKQLEKWIEKGDV